MPSQSPMKGSTKQRTRISAMTAGGNHQRHCVQKPAAVAESRGRLLLSAPASSFSSVFVARGIWVNELSFDRMIRPFHHLYAITLRIVLNFVHDVVDEEDAAARGAEVISRVARIRNLLNIKSLTFRSEERRVGKE